MTDRIEEQPYYSIFLDLINHPYYATHQEEAQFTADFLHQKGYRKRPQPLEDKEFEKALAEIIEKTVAPQYRASPEYPKGVATYGEWLRSVIIKDILALLQPKTEEATAPKCTAAFSLGLSMGKKQERERIVGIYTRYREVLSPKELRETMSKGKRE